MPQIPQFICPSCEEIMEHLKYSVSTTEYGNFYPDPSGDNDDIGLPSWETENNEWNDEPMYYCIHCDQEIDKDDARVIQRERIMNQEKPKKVINKLIEN